MAQNKERQSDKKREKKSGKSKQKQRMKIPNSKMIKTSR
jgi:hypothetical protein